MKNYPILLFVFVLLNAQLSAQSLLEGSITNENGSDITTATVKLHHNSDKNLTIESQIEEGYFFLENIANGEYWLEVSANNYEPIIIEHFKFPQDSDTVMGLTMSALEQNEKTGSISVKRGQVTANSIAGKQ